ncbi:hypothetical protein FACS189452_00950 [Bacteroidia bacterium]|nr:hypothetical protein FACS189452_00950 [Bacteroidia bacterium]
MKKKLFSVSILALTFALWGCSDDKKEVEQTLELSSATLSVEVDDKRNLEATTNGGTVTWRSENPQIATVNEFGGVEGITEGNTKIIASVGTGDKIKTAEVAVTVVPGTLPTPKGAWLFDDATDLFQARIGQPLQPGKGGKIRDAADKIDSEYPTTDLSGFRSVPGPRAGNLAVGLDKGYFFAANHGMAASLGGALVNEYSISWVVKFSEVNGWNSLLQTDPANSNDADCFVVDAGMGQSWSGRTDDKPLVVDQWHTLVFSMKCGADGHGTKEIYYVDGVPLPCGYSKGNNTLQDIDGNRSLDLAVVLFMADEDGDQYDLEVSDIRIWDVALTDDDVQKLHVKLNK